MIKGETRAFTAEDAKDAEEGQGQEMCSGCSVEEADDPSWQTLVQRWANSHPALNPELLFLRVLRVLCGESVFTVLNLFASTPTVNSVDPDQGKS
jgi:hypothetical protein